MRVAVVGSSGGGAATLGHTDPQDLLRRIAAELGKIRSRASDSASTEEFSGAAIRHALFVSLHRGSGLDSAGDSSTATLYAIGCCPKGERGVRSVISGTLLEVNKVYRRLDAEYVAPSIDSGEIEGLILISSDPESVNVASVSAAARAGLPATGSGGSSIGKAAALGVQVVGNAGGSVATTSHTRAVSYVYALADAWGCDYSPFCKGGNSADYVTVRPHIGSVLNSCVPAFVAVCVSSQLLLRAPSNVLISLGCVEELPALVEALQHYALPIVACVVSASAYAPEHEYTAIMAAGVASAGCGGSVLAGLFAGWLVACLVGRTLFSCIRLNIPATMTNIIVAGGLGVTVAIGMCIFRVTASFAALSKGIRSLVRLSFLYDESFGNTLASPPPGTGFIFGCIFCYGSKIGWYHRIFLPVILVEMERGEASIWGMVDECTLVLVSGGICAANVLASKVWKRQSKSPPATIQGAASDYAISLRGLRTNLLCGDFIEAAYPFMERSHVVNAFAYVASGISTEILYKEKPDAVLGSAYLPVFLSIYLADNTRRAALACSVAFGVSFLGGIIGNVIEGNTVSEHEGTRNNKRD